MEFDVLDCVFSTVEALKYNRSLSKKQYKIFRGYLVKRLRRYKLFYIDDFISDITVRIIEKSFIPNRQTIGNTIKSIMIDSIRSYFAKKHWRNYATIKIDESDN